MLQDEIRNISIAYCVTAYNNVEALRESLSGNIDNFKKNDIDVYVYDSSTNDEIYNLVTGFAKKGYANLTYVKIDSDLLPWKKVMGIYNGNGQTKQYDYIWLAKDRVYWSENLVGRVKLVSRDYPDVIMLNTLNDKQDIKEEYSNSVEFYKDFAWLVTSWDTTIIKKKSILDAVNYDEISRKYLYENNMSFPPVAVIFTALSQMDNSSIRVLDAKAGVHCFNAERDEDNRDSALFTIWGGDWYNANKNLPAVYDGAKAEVIKSATTKPWLIGNNHMRLIELYCDGNLTDEKLAQVKHIWNEISDISWEDVCKIKDGNIEFIEDCFVNCITRLIEESNMEYAMYYYNNSMWLVESSDRKEIKYISYILDVYFLELQQTGQTSIINGGRKRDYLFSKTELIIKIVKMLEQKTVISDSSVIAYIKSDMISKYAVYYIASRECSDPDSVLGKYLSYKNSF